MARDPITRNKVSLQGNPAAGQAMVFVNGIGTDQTVWKDVASAFAEDYRLVTFDHVGSVASNEADFRAHQHRYLNAKGYADDLLEICRTLELGADTIFVGHSLGANTILLAAGMAPQCVGRLVLLAASPRYLDTTDYRGGFSRQQLNDTYSAMGNDYASWSRDFADAAMQNPERPDLAQALAATLRRIPSDMMLTVLCSVLQADHRDMLAKVSAPTLIIQSRNDFFVPPEVAEYLRAHIRGSTLRLIDASGHLPHVSAPEQVVSAIRDFLAPQA